ncbi:hypothetical protein PENTCL1PPCAC_8028 [Pristionchus entomophagus]|uniref:Uncharacterized protein n=1 Tax=Pristionchus entomophagus TaxID=358040 RepID=A0AAV5SUU2_9BILA|nr:hypothetical protein PENTCL1PPCAC_8028 [Pristionchus entomophagus]
MDRELKEDERMLEQMREMDKELEQLKIPNREKYAQVDAQMPQVTSQRKRRRHKAKMGSLEKGVLEAQSDTESKPEIVSALSEEENSRVSAPHPHLIPKLQPRVIDVKPVPDAPKPVRAPRSPIPRTPLSFLRSLPRSQTIR